MPPIPDELESTAQINILPMIDVIFAILTFFILSTLFLTRSEGIAVNLPQAATATAQAQRLVVTVQPNGDLWVNRQAVTLPQLTATVRAEMTTGQPPLVVIKADEAVAHGRVMTVMDTLRQIPGVRLAVATEPR